MNHRLTTLTTCAGGFAAALLMQMSAAHADDTFIYTLDPGDQVFNTELSTTLFQNILEGHAGIDALDSNINLPYNDFIQGSGVETLNPFTGAVMNWDLVVTDNGGFLATYLPAGSQIDVMELGSGFSNQFVDIPGVAGALNSITDTLITPFGDYTLFSF
ncbi:hypothetical protein PT015_10380 [Candidatus Mycobacterium wuenschmannii]|uniref:PEP-CTERM sorting domain-containing protein n=1 Tax=Candidatus Mycobacterium wuenschmannii TaxID=3027808 RepID=A0ABY8W1R1_9MYCO|nr:hypothetical protein [Candidatus Mycobacterium wuenschmannii]WIM89788.1 hypothetical protein PT015_10380 [Candidatus Mycobacterium wuenschmannii]